MDFEEIYYTCKPNPNRPDIKIGKFSSKNYRSEGVSNIAHSVKSDNEDLLTKTIGINKIAQHIINQNVLSEKDYIVPAPQHTGRADYTLKIAKIISDKTGCKIADVLGCKPRDTLYNLKKKKGAKNITDSGLYLLTDKFPKYNVWFLDNVTATGTTFNDARKLIPHIKPLIYSISPRLKVKMKNRKPYFVRESNNYRDKNMKLEEGHWPKWKQKILDDSNALSEEVENNYTGDYWNNEKLKDLSLEDILSIVKKANKKFRFSELQEMHAAIEIWKGIHDDEICISYWASDEEKEEFYAHKFKQEMLDKCKELNHKLNKEIWPALEEEYQAKYGRKRNPQPYIKDPTDASEIFDKMSALKYESKKITQKRIEESFERVLNEARTIRNGQAVKSVESLFDFSLAKTYFEGLISDLNGKIIKNEGHRMVAYIDAPRTTSVILDLGSNYSSHNFELQVIISGKVQDAWEGNSDKEFITALDELFVTYENGEPIY